MMKKGKKILIILIVLLCFAFSCIYIWIRSLGKVTVPEFEKISENTYAYSEGMNRSNIYLLIGEEKAMLIDTGNGLSDLPKGIDKITDLPVIVVNTHGHYDHTRGNHYFETTYMSAADDEVFNLYNKPETVDWVVNGNLPAPLRLMMRYYLKTVNEMPIKENYLPLPESGYFDLGGRRLKIVELPGHTPGSIGLLDDQTGELFCGDAITSTGVLLGLDESLPMSVHMQTLTSVQELIHSNTVKMLYGGHGTFQMNLDIVQTFMDACNKIRSGDLTEKEKADESINYDGLEISFNLNKLD